MIRTYFHRILFVLILANTGPLSLTADSSSSNAEIEYHMQFKGANEAFAEEKDYQSALDDYLTILEARGPSINLLGNVAICYYKLEQYGHARLYLERARLIDPDHPDITNNYKVVLKALDLPYSNLSKIEKLVNLGSSNQWFLLAWVFISLPFAWVFLRVLPLFSKKPSKSGRTGFYWGSLLSISTGLLFLTFSNMTAKSFNYGIVTEKNAVLRQSPFEQAEEQFIATEGEMLEFTEQHGSYFLCITTENKGKGWITESDFQAVVTH